MNVEGSAVGACDCYTLTDDIDQSGAIWSPNTIDLTNPFDFTFEINLGCNDVWGADGIVFVLQSNGTGTGDIGNGMGYGDYVGNPSPISANSIGIEIDTWHSNPIVPSDIASDHIAMSSALGNDHDLVGPIAIPNIEDCANHTFQVTWDPVGQNLEVILDGNSIFTYTGDMVTNFFGGNSNVYFGWTGGTGGVMNVQTVCMYRNAALMADQTIVCANQAITFTDNSTSDLNMITNWDWDFGDAAASTIQNPTHAYSASGAYVAQLTITDISGCMDVTTINITISPDLNLNMTATNVTCFGAMDGQVTAASTNGVGPYTYAWDDLGAQTTETATGLGPDTYNVNVSDANGCVGNGTIVITQPVVLLLDSAIAVDASCGVNNGTITFYPNGGTTSYQYSIDGGATFQANPLFTGLAPNTYNLELQDANGCSMISSIVLNSNSALVLDSLVTTDETCGQADGTITAYVNLGLMPYQYSINGGVTYQASNIFSNLVMNNYTVLIMDANNCIVTGVVSVNNPNTLVIDTIIPTNPLCNGTVDGEIDIVASAGTTPYTYSTDSGVTFQLGTHFSGLPSGLYDIVVEDAAGCQTIGNISLIDPSPVLINSIVPLAVSCSDSVDGELDIMAAGGTPIYTYSIDGGLTFQTGNVFNGLAANTYTVQVNDVNNCSTSGVGIVSEPLALVIDSIVVLDATCNGLSDGGITIYSNQGTPAYQYSINGALTFQDDSVFTNLPIGIVSVDVQDMNGCITNGSTLIGESQPLLASIDTDTTICIGGIAVLCPTVDGGTPPFVYYWNGTPGTACFNANIPGTYSVEVVDANNCTSNLVSEEVFQYPLISILSTSDFSICMGNLAQLTAEASGGDGGPYTYNWVDHTDLSTYSGPIQNLPVNQATTFTVAVQDGCETPPTIGSVIVTIFPVPQIAIAANNYVGCEPLEVIFSNSTDPSLLASSIWNFGNGETFTGTATNVSTIYPDPACYDITVQITTVDGCTADSVVASLICVSEVPIADFSSSPNDPSILESMVQFDNHSQGGTNYNWTFGDGNSSTEFNPFNTYPEIGAQTYQVQLITSTAFGCTDTASKLITISEVVLFYAPNAITPNADPMNQEFLPIFIPGFDPLGYSLKIFDRWGTLVFESQNFSVGWDGRYNGVIVQDDTFVWQITFRENQTDIVHQEFGHITVLK